MDSTRRTIVIGGGFYGCCLAVFLRDRGDEVVLLETASQLLARASYNNQARVHGGYHYPRSILTGKSCVASLPVFAKAFPGAITRDFTQLYAIARVNSLVTADQFAGFCRRVGASVREAPAAARALFDRDLIEDVFQVEECAFDAAQLREVLEHRLAACGVKVVLNASAARIEPAEISGELAVTLGDGKRLLASQVFNCAYAGINELLRQSGLPPLEFRHELAELALVRPPKAIAHMGITVMDGPFFSVMPFPAEKLHSFSHVRYTPHLSWRAEEQSPDFAVGAPSWQRPETRFTQMLKDTVRYLPAMRESEYVRSLFEVKTMLGASERNDGRPILYRRDYGFPGLHVVMGGKIDNIFDILRGLSDRGGGGPDDLAADPDYFQRLFHVN
jgi:glycine/D-amino acid oxidase-like deaminating enzyme